MTARWPHGPGITRRLRAKAHLHLSYGVVAAIGFSCHHHPTAPLVPTPDHGLVVLPGDRCGQLLGIELIPKAIAAGPESRNSTVGRQASAAKDNYALEAMGRQRLCDFFGATFTDGRPYRFRVRFNARNASSCHDGCPFG